jgi:esterase/lipase superfamily enzyme
VAGAPEADTRYQTIGLDEQISAKATPDGPSLSEKLALKKNQLIELLYQIECLRPDIERDEASLRGSSATMIIPLYYATNRTRSSAHSLQNYFSAGDTRKLSYGTTAISVPSLHRPGDLELPSLWKLEWGPNSDRHFMVKSITALSSADALADMSAKLEGAKAKSLLIFVHGYNVTFYEASLRTAQLAYDLRFPGLTMFYSWPSAGTTTG